jgi:GT2 family glycosyltransferase/Flp pilus assembly protein TadD
MSGRHVFGPVTAQFADQSLRARRLSGKCVTFGLQPGVELVLAPDDSWESFSARLSGGPVDFVVLYLPYTQIPEWMWCAPIPIVGLAADWNLCWSWYRRCLRRCDLVLTDLPGVEVMAREGIGHARAANLFGCERQMVEEPWPEVPRDIDVLFAGNFHPAVQLERLAWLGRLSKLANHRRIVICSNVWGEDYRKLLARSRIVFNRSIRGECNKRVFEAAAAGALLFQEKGSREVEAIFRNRQDCIYYDADNLEKQLEYYLDHEDEWREVAESARRKVRTFEDFWDEHLQIIEAEWPEICKRAALRRESTGGQCVAERSHDEWLIARTWQTISTGARDATLIADLESTLKDRESASLNSALGIVTACQAGRDGKSDAANLALEYFERAVALDQHDPMAGLNLVEALIVCRELDRAVVEAKRVLSSLDQATDLGVARDAGHFPPVFDEFRVAWEQAGWSHAGDVAAEDRAKRQLIGWRLHSLLADLTGDLEYYEKAAQARPDSAATQAKLGCALARAGRRPEAIEPLRQAVEINPFDRQAARALFQTLEDAGFTSAKQRLARERRLLSRAAPGLVPLEDWAVRTPLVGDELVSIIILCCNQLDYTKQCVESVVKYSRRPYELVMVNNGYSDLTAGYLDTLKELQGSERIQVIHNRENLGFARGCNQALGRARGDYVVFLNNDTIVTSQWLNGLIRGVLTDWPRIGLAGPMSNYAPPPQQAQAAYQNIADLPAFAERWWKEHAGQAMLVDRLTGFCLLARRDVLNAIGDFDERFGTGFFEDDDLCVRAREAGFSLILARDIYIHHYGSKTFSGLGIDAPAQLDRNLEMFRDKWGPQKTAGYRKIELGRKEPATREPPRNPIDLSTIQPLKLNSRPRQASVSLSMIVKNEEHNLAACLRSVANLVDEIVVLDTGSTDQTRELAAKLGAKVIASTWPESFAAARNESLRHSTADWIFWIDADDRVDEANRPKLAQVFEQLNNGENAAYAMKCRCLAKSGEATLVDHVRLFRNRPDVRWKYRVHEQIIPAVKAAGGHVRQADVVIDHVGYLDREFRGQKHERNLRLLLMDYADDPNEPFTLFNLGWSYLESGKTAESIPYLRKSLELSHPSDSIVRKLYALLTEAHWRLRQKKEALAACRQGRKWYPDDEELLSKEAELRKSLGDLRGAEACWLRLLRGQEGAHFASVGEGARGFATRQRLAELYLKQGRLADAEAQWKEALKERPGYVPAVRGLGELYLRQQRFEDLDAFVSNLENSTPSGQAWLETMILKARRSLTTRQFDQARQILEQATERVPNEPYVWRLLSDALLQEGKDWDRAEMALRRVLELDPNCHEVRNNLAVLHRQQAQPPGEVVDA